MSTVYSKAVYFQIPLLNANDLHRLKDQQLVRFCGMVQDMFNPEYYFEEYEVVNKTTNEKSMRKGKYQDTTYFEVHFRYYGPLAVTAITTIRYNPKILKQTILSVDCVQCWMCTCL